jgi:perosamine synthetase
LLSGIPGLQTAADPDCGTTNYQSFWIAFPDSFPVPRDTLLSSLAAAGVSARRGIMAAHLEPAYAGHPHGELPVTERLTATSIVLPLFHEMTEFDQDVVVSVINAAAGISSPDSGQAPRLASQNV